MVRKAEDRPRYAGLPYVREQLEALGATFRLSEGPDRTAEGIMTLGPVPRTSGFEKLDGELVVKGPGGWEQDQIPDDQALVAKTPRGLVVLSGCAHGGIVNIIRGAREVAGEERVYAVLGWGAPTWGSPAAISSRRRSTPSSPSL